MSVAIEDDFFELPRTRIRHTSAIPFIHISGENARLNNRALDLVNRPEFIRILAKRSGVVRIVPADGRGDNDLKMHADGSLSRLHIFCRDSGFEAKRYGVRLVDGALEFQLERAPKEVE